MKDKIEFNENMIREILEKDLRKINNVSFNDQIIRQLELSQKERKTNVFNHRTIFLLFICSGLSLLGFLSFQSIVSEASYAIGILICILPTLFMFYNWLFKTATQNSLKK